MEFSINENLDCCDFLINILTTTIDDLGISEKIYHKNLQIFTTTLKDMTIKYTVKKYMILYTLIDMYQYRLRELEKELNMENNQEYILSKELAYNFNMQYAIDYLELYNKISQKEIDLLVYEIPYDNLEILYNYIGDPKITNTIKSRMIINELCKIHQKKLLELKDNLKVALLEVQSS